MVITIIWAAYDELIIVQSSGQRASTHYRRLLIFLSSLMDYRCNEYVAKLRFMTNTEEYLAAIKPEQQTEIRRLMEVVRWHVPTAEEGFAYGMPAFKYEGKPLVYFGAFKDHMSIFPTSAPLDDPDLSRLLDGFEVSKGTVKFTLDKPVPDATVIALLDHRIAAIQAHR